MPVALNVFVAGLKISALARSPPLFKPPATSTRPSGSGAAAARERGVVIEPVGLKEPLAAASLGPSSTRKRAQVRSFRYPITGVSPTAYAAGQITRISLSGPYRDRRGG